MGAKAKKQQNNKSANAETAKATVQMFVNEGDTNLQKDIETVGTVMSAGKLNRSRQPWVLSVVVQMKRVTMEEVATHLGIDIKRAGRILRALEAHGLIERDPKDASLDKATFSALGDNVIARYTELVKANKGKGLKGSAGSLEEVEEISDEAAE